VTVLDSKGRVVEATETTFNQGSRVEEFVTASDFDDEVNMRKDIVRYMAVIDGLLFQYLFPSLARICSNEKRRGEFIN